VHLVGVVRMPGEIFAFDEDPAAHRAHQAGNGPQKQVLSAPFHARQTDDLPSMHVQVDVVQGQVIVLGGDAPQSEGDLRLHTGNSFSDRYGFSEHHLNQLLGHIGGLGLAD
jgi:hypothetical protein